MKGNTKARPSVRVRTGGRLTPHKRHNEDGEEITVTIPGDYTGGSRKANRLADRQAAHTEYPVSADGSEYNKQKPKAKLPGSMNPRKH